MSKRRSLYNTSETDTSDAMETTFSSIREDRSSFDTTDSQDTVTTQENTVTTQRNLVLTEKYYVALGENQRSILVLKPGDVITMTTGEDGNIYPECFRSLLHANILKKTK